MVLTGLSTTMKISNFESWISLGCTSEEQKFLQPVHLSVEIFPETPASGLETDQLSDVLDYVEICQILKTVSISKSFKLIEHLNFLVMQALSDNLKAKKFKGQLKVHVQKLRVPVENLRDGVTFSCETRF